MRQEHVVFLKLSINDNMTINHKLFQRSWETSSTRLKLGVFFDICQPADACQFNVTPRQPLESLLLGVIILLQQLKDKDEKRLRYTDTLMILCFD